MMRIKREILMESSAVQHLLQVDPFAGLIRAQGFADGIAYAIEKIVKLRFPGVRFSPGTTRLAKLENYMLCNLLRDVARAEDAEQVRCALHRVAIWC